MKKNRASISLITLLVISAFTLIVVVAVSSAGISNYDQAFNYESSKISYYMAESCLEEALKRIEEDTSFSGTSVALDADTQCTISSTGTSSRVLTVTVDFLEYSQSYEAEVSVTQVGEVFNTELLTWKEI